MRRFFAELRNEWRLAVKQTRHRRIMIEVERIRAERGNR